MKHYIIILVFTIALFESSICSANSIVRANNIIAFKLFNKQSVENSVFCPFAISQIIGEYYLASNELERSMIFKFWDIRQKHDGFLKDFKSLMGNVTSAEPDNLFLSSNLVLLSEKYTFDNLFRNNVQDFFGTETYNVNFNDDNQSLLFINSYASKITNGIIDRVEKITNSSTTFVFLNFSVFKSEWNEKFNAATPRDFTLSDGSVKKVSTMDITTTNIEYTYVDDFVCVKIPFKSGKYSMVVASHPDIKKLNCFDYDMWYRAIEQFKSKLSSAIGNSDKLNKEPIILELPKFSLKGYKLEILKTLREIGLPYSTYNNIAQESLPISMEKMTSISDIEVDEKGCIAKSVTYFTASYGSNSKIPQIIKINKAFRFFIIDNSNSLILFMGTIIDPEK